MVKKVYYPSLGDEYQSTIYQSEYLDSGSIISFEVEGEKKEAFKILNAFKVFKLAVSLGSVESLIQHPSSMTHSDMSEEEKSKTGITESLLRCSVGLEDISDLIGDLDEALKF